MRKLKADEIECRVAQVTAKGCSLLLYKTARVDRAILDEEFGQYYRHDRCASSEYDEPCGGGRRILQKT